MAIDNYRSREQWGAKHPLPPSISPTSRLVLHHTVGRYRGDEGTRDIDHLHGVIKGWTYGYAYNFGIDPTTLTLYEGRGELRAGGHTRGYNYTSQAIVVYGDYRTDPVTDELLERIAEVVLWGSAQKWWPNKITHGHRDLSTTGTVCPGNKLYDAIPDINYAILNGKVPDNTGKEFIELMETLRLYDGWKQNTHLRNEVRRLQAWLAIAGVIAANTFKNNVPDGLFGPGTKEGVIEFQRSKGLTADGIAGPKTWDALANA